MFNVVVMTRGDALRTAEYYSSRTYSDTAGRVEDADRLGVGWVARVFSAQAEAEAEAQRLAAVCRVPPIVARSRARLAGIQPR